MDNRTKEKIHDIGKGILMHINYYASDGLKDQRFIASLIEEANSGDVGIHAVYYTMEELKIMVNSPMDNTILQKLKRYMHLIMFNKNMPGEIFRPYPIKIDLATLEFRDFLRENTCDKDRKYYIECSNFGRIKVNGNISKPIEEKLGWLYIYFGDTKYPVYRIVAETWCMCTSGNSSGWQVHHISNDGYDNTPENLLWIKGDAHKKIGTPREQKMKLHFDEDKNVIEKIIEELNLQ